MSTTLSPLTTDSDRPGRAWVGKGRPVTQPEPLPAVAVPTDQAGIDVLRTEIDQIDADLVRLIQRRTAISQAIGAARASLGGTRIVYSREMAILERFRPLGPAGTDLGMLLLNLGRGQLGRRSSGD